MKHLFLLSFLFSAFFVLQPVRAQDEPESISETYEESEERQNNKNSFALVIAHAHINSGLKNGQRDDIAIPAFGLHYNRRMGKKWGLGIHTELLIEEFEVVDSRGTLTELAKSKNEMEEIGLERGKPFSVALMGIYQPHKHLAILVGGGMEFSKNENFALVRIGVDIPIVERNNWEAFGTINYDVNIDAYDSFNFGIGISRWF